MTPERMPGSSSQSSVDEKNDKGDQGHMNFYESDNENAEIIEGLDQNDHDNMEVDDILSLSGSSGNKEDDISLGQNSFTDNGSENSIER